MMQSAYSFRTRNIRKTWILFIVFLVLIIGIGYAVSYYYESPVILYIAVGISLLLNITAYWKSDTVVMALNNAKRVERGEQKELYNLLENMCISQGMEMPALYVVDDPSPNAFATGRNPSHAAIAVTSGLLEKLDRSELEGVLAHELTHVKNYDTLVMTVVVVLVGTLALISDFFIRMMWFGGGKGGERREGGGNPILLIMSIAAIIIAPIAGMIIQLAISRKREFAADSGAVLITRYPEGLASALEKIASAKPLKKAKEATAHLYIANPFKADVSNTKTPFFAKLFMTHPPIEERIEALRKM